MLRLSLLFVLVGLVLFLAGGGTYPESEEGSACVVCHEKTQPKMVADWRQGKHAEIGMTCEICHEEEHTTAEDAHKAKIPSAIFCGACHDEQFQQFQKAKHALAWVAMKAMPTVHFQPMELIDGKKGCGGCHKIGLKDQKELERLKKEGHTYGVVACDSCHTRHLFSVEEARQPEA